MLQGPGAISAQDGLELSTSTNSLGSSLNKQMTDSPHGLKVRGKEGTE